MKKRKSKYKTNANQRNGSLSTGPKTPNGKSISKLNALKFGLYAKDVVIRGYKIRERPREFKRLCQEYIEHLAPVGPVEEMLVIEIATLAWRLRRVRIAEAGEIALSVDQGWRNRHRSLNPGMQWFEWEEMGDPIRNMEDSGFGNRILEGLLTEAREAVERDGELTEATIQKVVNGFGKPNRFTRNLDEHRLKMLENPAALDAGALRKTNKIQTLKFLDNKLRMIRWQKGRCEELEACEEQAQQAADILPEQETLDKILRYESALQKRLYRAMNHLERLQRRRLGENVPPPLTMEISSGA